MINVSSQKRKDKTIDKKVDANIIIVGKIIVGKADNIRQQRIAVITRPALINPVPVVSSHYRAGFYIKKPKPYMNL